MACLVMFGWQWVAACKSAKPEDTPPPKLSEVRHADTVADPDSWEFIADKARVEAARNARLNVFVAPFSMNKTVSPSVYVRSPEPFRLRIYRLGWYPESTDAGTDAGTCSDAGTPCGRGASLVYDSLDGSNPILFSARNHTPEFRCGYDGAGGTRGDAGPDTLVEQSDRDFGLVECPWENPITPTLSDTASGLYMARVTATIDDTVYDAGALFVLRDDGSTERLVIVNPTTEQAYNTWTDQQLPDGGWAKQSLYTTPRASKVSFNRPLEERPNLLKNEYPFLRFLDREGIPYAVATDYDIHTEPTLFANRKSIVVAGHGEYWSGTTRSRLDEAVDAGKNLVALAANTGYWQVRYEASPAGMPSPVVVGYKESAVHTEIHRPCSAIIVPDTAESCADPVMDDLDPNNDHTVTTNFRDPQVGKPEQLLLGVQFQQSPESNLWEIPVTLFTDVLSSLQSTDAGITDEGHVSVGLTDPDHPSKRIGNIGHEADVLHPQGLMLMNPGACLKVLAEAPWEQELASGPLSSEAGNYVAHLVLYRPTPTSGYVFGGFSMLWSWGVDDWAAVNWFGGAKVSRVDPRLVQLTRNMLNAAETPNAFGSDCDTPLAYSVFFGRPGGASVGTQIILKEDQYPGRWAIVPITQDGSHSLFTPAIKATADLSGWAVGSGAYDLFVADVNADGKSDLIAKEKASGNWAVALSNGSTFEPQPLLWLQNWANPSSDYDLLVADVNSDDQADLVRREKSSDTWQVAVSTGNGFTPINWQSPSGLGGSSYDFFVADVNSDHKSDLIAKERTSPGYWKVAMNTDAGFGTPATWLDGGWAVESSAYDLFVANVDGDGGVDLIAKEKNSPGNWYVARNTGSSFLPEPAVWLSGWAVNSSAYTLYVADVNNDGKADLIAKDSLGKWYVAHSTGGSFGPQSVLALEPLR